MSPLGGYIVRRREQLGWTRAELSRASNVPYSTLSNIELNKRKVKPSEETLRAIANALGDDSTQLLILAGYGVVVSNNVSERARRLEALMAIAPRWEKALQAVQNDMSPGEQDEALTALEVHIELVRRRRRRGSS